MKHCTSTETLRPSLAWGVGLLTLTAAIAAALVEPSPRDVRPETAGAPRRDGVPAALPLEANAFPLLGGALEWGLQGLAEAQAAALSEQTETALVFAAQLAAPQAPEASWIEVPPRVAYRVELRPAPDADGFDPPPVAPEVDEDAQEAEPQPQSPVGGAFAMPEDMLRRLDALAAYPVGAAWGDPVREQLEALTELRSADDPRAGELLDQLADAARQAEAVSLEADALHVQTDIRRAGHALARRVQMWRTLHGAYVRVYGGEWSAAVTDRGVAAATRISAASLTRDGWATASDRSDKNNPLRPSSGQQMRELLDAEWLLAELEQYELHRSPSGGREIAGGRTLFAAASVPEVRSLESQIERQYRNANFRMALSAELLNRMLPQPEPFGRQVHDTIVGVPVRGYSTTMTQLSVRLVPDDQLLRLALEARGTVQSKTSATSGPAVLFNRGATNFAARKLVVVGDDGMRSFRSAASATSANRLIGVRTEFDDVPLLGSLVRQAVIDRQAESRGAARREVESKVSREVSERFDAQVAPLVQRSAANFYEHVWLRLQNLGLDVQPTELATTEQRVTARVRIAADDQLAAHTPRPRAPSDSLMSLQLHESALNNFLQQIGFDGQEMTLREVFEHVVGKLGAADAAAPEELPDDVVVKFAERDAFRVRFVDGAAELTISLAQVSRGADRWTNLQVTALYEPQAAGLDARLARDAGLLLAGDRMTMRSQIMLRGVFSKLLDKSRTFALVPPQIADNPRLQDFEITQLQIQDGWIGVAIGPHNAPSGVDSDLASLPRWEMMRELRLR